MKIKKSVKTTALSLAMCALLCGSTISTLSLVPFSSSQAYAVSSYAPDASAKSILNSAKLNPQKTGYKVIDDKVEALLSQFRKEGAKDTYSLVKASYDWIIKNTSYGGSGNKVPDLGKAFGYASYNPHLASDAWNVLFENKGVCDDYTAAFVVMTRAIGLESYKYSGQTRKVGGGYTGHAWAEININGNNYIFDTQVEDNVAGTGNIRYLYFCKTETEMKDSYIWQADEKIKKTKSRYNASIRLQEDYDYVVSNLTELQTLLRSQKVLADKTIAFDQVIDRNAVKLAVQTAFPNTECEIFDGADDHIRIQFPETLSVTRFTEVEKGKSEEIEVYDIPNNVSITAESSNSSIVKVEEISSSTSSKTFKVTGLKVGTGTIIFRGSDGYTQSVEIDVLGSEIPLNKTNFEITQKVGKDYLIIKGATDPSLVKFTSAHSSVNFKFLEKTSEGLKYEITTPENFGEYVYVSYQDKTSRITVNSVPISGSIMLDTINYKMSKGNIYDIGITITDGETKKLTGSQIKQLVDDGILRVTDSRSGSIVNLTQLSNGNFRVTGKNPGTCYIVYEIMDGNKAVTHASVRLDVENGVKQHGVATRNTSYWTPKLFSQYSW